MQSLAPSSHDSSGSTDAETAAPGATTREAASVPAESLPSVVALVLNYNGKEVTLQTLASLSLLDYPNIDLVVVDNGSTDDSWAAVEKAYPAVKQIRVPENQGISFGMNFGLRHAVAGLYDYILILNNDIEVDPGMVSEMVRVAESDPSIGAVGPKAYYFGDRERLWSAGGILRFRESVTRERGDKELDRGQFDADQEVDYVNGCAMLVRRQALLDTGAWDSTYFLGVEDADWCMRMKAAGWRCWYAHKAVLWHMISHSTGVFKPGRTFQTGRSTAIFVRKYAGIGGWASFLLFATLSLPLAWLRELPKGNAAAAVAKAKGILEGLRVPMRPLVPLGDRPIGDNAASQGTRPGMPKETSGVSTAGKDQDPR